ncbi:hypothetical protein VOLCADRAFT_108378 [Volvox carteri f. nagariensis]|uniref:GYF domain-containing protein n=1 Tax=Volvox carteri f. nagariensis TaxID=3068 RepID=D8UJS5_VOLCA|nr:uncharacterized protein VOLCADRAFT_108378 [Volvox carteri f. nagariensis]EFJ40027.1 hypothetical protein VOLCADRAFT_108378 [Volvox carteri f. nagariensis]|eukprot:XP_002958896.1 hypothetical protein VOLCADRAFT_108378 [Volvox carteri f. nagariensis]
MAQHLGSATWRGPDAPSNRDPKWPEKDRPDYNAARDRPARWREREEDSRDRNNTWDNDRQIGGVMPVDVVAGVLLLTIDGWIGSQAVQLLVSVSGSPVCRRSRSCPSAPQSRTGGARKARTAVLEKTVGAHRALEVGLWPGVLVLLMAASRRHRPAGAEALPPDAAGDLNVASGPAAPGSGAPDRWDVPRGGHLDRHDSNAGPGGSGSGYGSGGHSGVRRYSSPVMSKIYNHMLSSHGEKLPMPRINPEVALQYSEYLSESVAEAAAQQLGGGGSSSGAGESANGLSGGGTAPAGAAHPGGQTQLTSVSSNPPVPSLPVTHELYLQDQWVYKDPQGVTQGPFTRMDILDWLAFHYFGEDLPIRAAALEGTPFIPLGQMMKMWDAIERGRPLGPPGFTPAAPTVALPNAAADANKQPQVTQTQQATAAAVAPLPSVSSIGLSAAASGDLSQAGSMAAAQNASSATAAAPGGTAQRTSSLLETLLGKKLASESPVQQPTAATAGLGGLQGPLGTSAPVPLPDNVQQPGVARPFTLDPPVQLHSAGSNGLGGTPLGGLGGLGGPLGGGLGGFGSGLPGAAGMGPGGLGGMGGPAGIGPGPWGGPLVGPGGPLPGAPGGPVLPGWGRDPLVGGYDPLRRPDLHPGIHGAAGIWGSGPPFRPEGPPLGPGPFVPQAAVAGDTAAGQPGLAPLSDALLSKPEPVQPQPPAPGPLQANPAMPPQLPPPQQVTMPIQQQTALQQQQQQQLSQASAWGTAPVQPVAASRSLADIQREQAMEAARQAALREQQQQQAAALAEAVAAQQTIPAAPPAPTVAPPAAQELPPMQGALPSHQPQAGAWGAAVVPEPYRPISGLPPALQQLFATANRTSQPGSESAPAELQALATEPVQQSTTTATGSASLTDTASASAAGTGGGKKKKTPQLVLQEQPKPQTTAAPQPATVTAVAAEDVSAGAGQSSSTTVTPRPEPKLAPWASAAAAKPPTSGMTLREIQMQEAEAAARAARAAAAAPEATPAQSAVATMPAAAAAAATPAAAAPAGVSPWAKIAAATPGPNAAVANTVAPAPPPPAPAGTAWRPAPPPAAPQAPAVATPTGSSIAADTSPSRKTAPIASNAAAAVAPAARGGRPAVTAAPVEPPTAPVGVTGTAPRGTTLAELLEKQLNPAAAAASSAAPKAWGGAAAKPPPVTNLRAVIYEESAAELEGGVVEEDLSDVLPMLQQQKPPVPPVSANGGWSAAPAPPPGPTLRDIQQQEEEAARRRAAAAAPPVRAASTSASSAAGAEDEGLFWDYGPVATAPAAPARAASIEAPKPAAAAKPAAPAPPSAPVSARGGWASMAAAAAPPPPTAAAVAAKSLNAVPAARASAAAVIAKPAAAAVAPTRASAPAPAPATSTSYAPAAMASNPGGDDSAGLFDGEIQMSAEFRNWCRSKMVEFFGNDDLSLVHFLLTVNSRSEVADYCQVYMRGKPNVSTFVADFLKRKDAELARQASGSKGKNKGSGGGSAGAAAAKGATSKSAVAVSEWQKATSTAQQAAASGGNKKGGSSGGGKQPTVKKVGGITATVPGFSLLSDRA